jgi:Tetratricopeptide repeat
MSYGLLSALSWGISTLLAAVGHAACAGSGPPRGVSGTRWLTPNGRRSRRRLGRQRRCAEAEQLTREALADRRRLLGDDHPDTAAVRAEFAQFTADRPAS